MPGLAKVSQSRSGLLPLACHPHASCCTTPPSSDSPRALRWRQEHLAQREAQLPPMEGLQEGSAPCSQVNSRTQRLPVCPQGCASGGYWGLELHHEHTFPLFIPPLHPLWASSPAWSSWEQPNRRIPSLHLCLPLSPHPPPAASSLASQQHAGPSHAMGRLGLIFVLQGEQRNPAASVGVARNMAGSWVILWPGWEQDSDQRAW